MAVALRDGPPADVSRYRRYSPDTPFAARKPAPNAQEALQ
jgi:hypothetical protein